MFRGTALRVFLAVLIGLMSFSFGTAMAEESGDPAAEIETTTTTDESTDTSIDSIIDESTLPADEGEADTTSDEETDTASESDSSTDGETDTSTDESELTPETGEGEADITSSGEDNGQAPARRMAPAGLQTTSVVETGTVSIRVSSSDPSIATVLPSNATWTVSQGDTVLDSDTFAADDLTLPATIDVAGQVPYGHYTVTVNAGPVFKTFTDTFRVDEATENFNIGLTPVKTSSVSVTVKSKNPDIAATLPADATWTVLQDGVELDSDTFAAGNLTLPASIPVNTKLPYGDYEVEVSAGPTFKPFYLTYTVESASHAFEVMLDPVVTQTTATIKLTSADPDVAVWMPDGASWSVTNGTQTFGDTFDQAHLKLPVTIPVSAPLPVGDYSVTINAAPTFATYTGTVKLSEFTQVVEIALVPVAQSNVTISLSSADATVTQLPSGSTWTVTSVANPDFTFSDEFAESDLALPQNIKVVYPVPYGEYIITVDGGDTFAEKTMTVTISEPTQTVPIELTPTSLVDELVQILIQILSEILEGSAA